MSTVSLNNGWSVYQMEDELFDSIKDKLKKEFECNEGKCTEYEYYNLKLNQDNYSVVVKQYYTGKLTVQGKKTGFFDDVCSLIERNSSPEVDEIARRFIPENEPDIGEIQKKISSRAFEAESKIRFSLKNSYNFLYDIDNKYLITSQCLFDLTEEQNVELPDYSGLVMSASKAFEGFAIKLFIEKGELDINEIRSDPKSIELNWDRLRKHLLNPNRDKYIIPKLLAEYNRCRNFTLHSDPIRDSEMSFDKAKLKLCTIYETIEEAYNIFYPRS